MTKRVEYKMIVPFTETTGICHGTYDDLASAVEHAKKYDDAWVNRVETEKVWSNKREEVKQVLHVRPPLGPVIT